MAQNRDTLFAELIELYGEAMANNDSPEAAAFAFIRRFGGHHLYVPKMVSLLCKARNGAILKQHFVDGMSARELGMEYGITSTRVRQIIKKAGGGRKKKRKTGGHI